MNIAQIEENVKSLLESVVAGNVSQDDFIYELLLSYGHRKQSVTRLRSGERNMASRNNEPRHDEVIWKRHLYYKHIEGNALHAEIDRIRKEKTVATNKLRFVIVTNFDQLLAVDTKTTDTLDINFGELTKQFDFFLPWAGMEKAVYQGENPADVKAAEKMAKLFDLIKADNFDESNKNDTDALHNLNVFLTRLLFCFFAEDTEIFGDNQFSNAIQSHTKDDGSDLSDYLNRLFKVLNTSEADREELPEYLSSFPYVNGGLFADDIPAPMFSAKSRRMLIECGSELDWSDINPDIFGSMIQAVVHPDQRGGMGMHYTSVTNIMKVIEPLFLNDLYEELDKVEGSTTKLQKLQQRLGELKIFDPACGSGNFLIIAYKELRKLEMEVLKRLQELELEKTGQLSQPFSVIKLSQFYGIELDDFAHEVAILSLWLAEHQMNVEFKTEFGESLASLPLKKSNGIKSGNSAELSWVDVCPCAVEDEVYVVGNPPYLGARQQSPEQKEDIRITFGELKGANNLDYISIWFKKASEYIAGREGCKFSFVSTNSISQGSQVPILWPVLLSYGIEVCFAHTSFKWTNSAKSNAGVICVVIGMRNKNNQDKHLYENDIRKEVSCINGYLAPAENVFIHPSNKVLSGLPAVNYGSFALDDGLYTLDAAERDSLINEDSRCDKFIRPFVGAKELIQGGERHCIWIDDIEDVLDIPVLKDRVERVRQWRSSSKRQATVKLAQHPHKFAEIRQPSTNYLAFPTISSERRRYIPARFFTSETVASNQVYIIPNALPWHFGVVSSAMHMAWIKSVGGRLKSDYRYSAAICYNTFPKPNITADSIDELNKLSLELLAIREKFPEASLATLYDPEKMPNELLRAHYELDVFFESLYSKEKLHTDEDRLGVLMDLYMKMTGGQNA